MDPPHLHGHLNPWHHGLCVGAYVRLWQSGVSSHVFVSSPNIKPMRKNGKGIDSVSGAVHGLDHQDCLTSPLPIHFLFIFSSLFVVQFVICKGRAPFAKFLRSWINNSCHLSLMVQDCDNSFKGILRHGADRR